MISVTFYQDFDLRCDILNDDKLWVRHYAMPTVVRVTQLMVFFVGVIPLRI